MLERVLDALIANAQVRLIDGSAEYTWGQHTVDDAGQNLRQAGLHGTSQAVLALASGVRALGEGCRYEGHLVGGVHALERMARSPSKELDLFKTVKVAELVAATAKYGNGQLRSQLVEALLKGQDSATRGWSFDLRNPTPAQPWPTVYAIDGLSYQCREDGTHADAILAATHYCLDQLTISPNPNSKTVAFLGKLAESVHRSELHLDERAKPLINDLRNRIAFLWNYRPDLLRSERTEYRIARVNGEEPAFCTIPSGIAFLRSALWAFTTLGQTKALALPDSLADLVRFLMSPFGSFPTEVRTLSYVARLLADLGASIDENLGETAVFFDDGAISMRIATASKPQASQVDAVDAQTRSRLYADALRTREEVANVRILKELTGGLSGVPVDLCEVIDTRGAAQLTQVFKLMPVADAEQEAAGAKLAAKFIPSDNRIELYDNLETSSGQRLLRYRYATPSLQRGRLQSFLEFFEQSESAEIMALVKELFDALAKTHQSSEAATTSLRELIASFETARGGRFWESVNEGVSAMRGARLIHKRRGRILLTFPFQAVVDVVESLGAVGDLFPGSKARCSHGDLNPRNVLVIDAAGDSDFRPVVIDFHRFSELTPQTIDFARFEVGLHVKGLASVLRASRDDADERADVLIRYEEIVNGSYEIAPDKLSRLGLPLLKRAGTAASRVRESFQEVAPQPVGEDPRFYFATLLLSFLSYARPVYTEILTTDQRLFALYCAGQICQRWFR